MSALETLGVFSPLHFDHRIHGEKGVLVLNLMGSLFARRNKLRRQATLFGVLALVFFPGLMLIGDHGNCLDSKYRLLERQFNLRFWYGLSTMERTRPTPKTHAIPSRHRQTQAATNGSRLPTRVLNPAPLFFSGAGSRRGTKTSEKSSRRD